MLDLFTTLWSIGMVAMFIDIVLDFFFGWS